MVFEVVDGIGSIFDIESEYECRTLFTSIDATYFDLFGWEEVSFFFSFFLFSSLFFFKKDFVLFYFTFPFVFFFSIFLFEF